MARVRITGISTPWLGVSWEYRESDAVVVRRVFSFLEDRRVLYEPLNAQIFFYVGQSAAEIRQMLTQELGASSLGEQLSESFKAIRAALRRFMDDLEKLDQRVGSRAGAVALPDVRSGSQFSPGFPCGPLHCGDRCQVAPFPAPARQTVHAVFPHTAYRRRSPPAFGLPRQSRKGLGSTTIPDKVTSPSWSGDW